MREDLQYLKILSMCHYILAGILAVFGCFPLLYVGIGIMFISPPASMTSGGQPPPPPELGWMMVVIGIVACLFMWALAILLFFGGRYLARRQHYIFCMVVAGISCVHMPLGTVLGVFTIVVLVRPNVKELFQAKARQMKAAAL